MLRLRPKRRRNSSQNEKRRSTEGFLCETSVPSVLRDLIVRSEMKADILTIFPGFFSGPLDHGITRRAAAMGLVQIEVHDLRQFTHDRHRTVDDRPFGGGEGMVLKPEPLFECLESLQLAPREVRRNARSAGAATQSVIVLSAQGEPFTQKIATELAGIERMVLICGRYEGVD